MTLDKPLGTWLTSICCWRRKTKTAGSHSCMINHLLTTITQLGNSQPWGKWTSCMMVLLCLLTRMMHVWHQPRRECHGQTALFWSAFADRHVAHQPALIHALFVCHKQAFMGWINNQALYYLCQIDALCVVTMAIQHWKISVSCVGVDLMNPCFGKID